MEDIIGYDRQIHADGEIMSSEAATISFGGRKRSLVQQFQAGYQHRVEPIYELGSPDVYLVKGQPMGNVNISRLVGRNGFLDGLGGTQCGSLDTVTIGTDGRTCHATPSTSSLRFSGAIIQGLQFSSGAGQLQAADSVSIIAPKLIKEG